MKAYAASIAEEIGTTFDYSKVPLDNASHDDLNLIDHAIDGEECDDRAEDWTCKLGINLQYCVRVRKNSSSKQVQNALKLDGLFTKRTSNLKAFHLKWPSRKCRSKRNLNNSIHLKSSDGIKMENPALNKADVNSQLDNPVLMEGPESIQMENQLQEESSENVQSERVAALGGAKLNGCFTRLEGKLIQYSRRSSKSKSRLCGSAEVNKANHQLDEVSAGSIYLDKCSNTGFGNNFCDSNTSLGLNFLDSSGSFSVQHECGTPISIRDASKIAISSQSEDSVLTTQVIENMEKQTEGITFQERIMMHKEHNSTINDAGEIKAGSIINENERFYVKNSPCSPTITVQSATNAEAPGKNEAIEEICQRNVTSDPVNIDNSVGKCNTLSKANGVVPMREASGSANLAPVLLDSAMNQECQKLDGKDEKEDHSSNFAPINESPPVSVEEQTVPNAVVVCMQSSEKDHSFPDNRELENCDTTMLHPMSTARRGVKRRKEAEMQIDIKSDFSGFIRSPCEGLRPRAGKDADTSAMDCHETFEEKPQAKKTRKPSNDSPSHENKREKSKVSYRCDLEGCRMSFKTKEDLLLHKRNLCPYEGCGKEFSSHKYAVHHQRVHGDERPLKCPWKGCTMAFKWAWARTEHLRVHTGERPYKCKVEGCGLAFRFISDFSRHRRKTGHYVN